MNSSNLIVLITNFSLLLLITVITFGDGMPQNASVADQTVNEAATSSDQQDGFNVTIADQIMHDAATSTSNQQVVSNATIEVVELITDTVNGTDQQQQAEEAGLTGPQPAVAGGELANEGNVPLVSAALADDQNAKNESGSNSSDTSSGNVADTTKFIPHGDNDCWTDDNVNETPRWIANGEQIERGIVWYECREGKLVTIGCIDENGKRLTLNGTYQSGRYRMQCVPFGENARRQMIGCVPDGQLDKTYLPGEIWVDNVKQIWWQCVLENAWPGGCFDVASNKSLIVGEAIDSNFTTYECQHKHMDGFHMVPVGCIFDGIRYSVGLYWQDDDFVFFCKLQRDDSGSDATSTTCIDCILRNQRLFDDEHIFQNEHAVKCEKRLAPEGYTPCVR
uniref:Secreted protein n=1 Tax=Globodera rostochiensis TaxID=31243 RepID=A0A914H7Q2_GLORO